MTESSNAEAAAPRTLEAWALWQSMVADLTEVVKGDAETERELLDGLQVLTRCVTLSTELNVDSDPEQPYFFLMDTAVRYVGGPNPDGEYHLCLIEGTRGYRITGTRGTSTYLGFQVLAGQGMEPRRQAAYLSDRVLQVADDGTFSIVLSPEGAGLGDEVLAAADVIEVPADAGAIVVRQYTSSPDEVLADFDIEPLEDVGLPTPLTDELVAERITAAAWTIAKLVTLHKCPVMQEMVAEPNRFFAHAAAALNSADTTPDNLYVLGTWRLDPGEALVIDVAPPDVRFWNLVVSNIWHECFDVRRRQISLTNDEAVANEDGTVRLVLAGEDPGVANWLDTSDRHRGFLIFRWLDDPAEPPTACRVVPVGDVAGLPPLELPAPSPDTT
jgi:hypothetical protein